MLYSDNESWVKKQQNGIFDVTMGSFDGAEVCEIVGFFLLDLLGKRYDKQAIGLYKDDGLAIFKNQKGRQNDIILGEPFQAS